VLLSAGNRQGLEVSLLPKSDYFHGLAANARQLARLTGGDANIWGMIGTSLAVACGVALLSSVTAFLVAFSLTFFPTRLARIAFAATLLTLYFPIEARMLPTFDVTLKLGLINTLPGLILPILPIAVATFVFRQHLRTLPPEILEAARLDGAGPIRFLKDFAIPLSIPPIFAVLLITFLVGWNQYLWPLMISTDNTLFPVMRGLNLAGSGSGPSLFLGAVSLLPPLVLVLAFARALTRAAGLRA
jgi:sn-glycerol 3-phosphate transport system permease protein